MTLHSLARPFATAVSLVALACVPGPGSSSDEGSSTGSTATGDETTSVGMTSLASSTSSPPITAGEESSSTGAPVPMEYVGFWTTGFGYVYFTACGESESWYAYGLPAFEGCWDEAQLWLRLVGTVRPPMGGELEPVIEVLEILEGPCTGGSCDGSVEIGECGTFEELCFTPMSYECDLFAQDCPMGEKCMPWAYDGGMEWNGTRCAPLAAMPGGPGEACMVEGGAYSGIDDCELGAMCWGVDPDTLQGECAALCDQALMPDPVCPAGTTCMPFFPMEAEPPWPVGVCEVV